MTEHGQRAKQVLRPPIAALLVVIAVAGMFGLSVVEHVRSASDPWAFTDDARQDVWPMFRYGDASLFSDDYIADYYLSFNPKGYTQLYRLASNWAEPRTISVMLPYFLMAATLVGVAIAAWALGGPIAAWTAMVLCMSGDLFLARAMGGLPRSFGLPVMSLLAAGLVLRRPALIVTATLLGAAFYYPAAVVGGISLTLFLALPPSWGGLVREWSWARRAVVLASSGIMTLLIALPSVINLRRYGSGLGPEDWGRWPEGGLGGRFGPHPVGLFSGEHIAPATAETARELLLNSHRWSLPLQLDPGWVTALVFSVAAIGTPLLLAKHRSARSLFLLLPAMAIAYGFASATMPFLYRPERYLRLVQPLSIIVIPAAICALWSLASVRWRASGALASCALVLGLVSGVWWKDLGIERVPDRQRPALDYLSSLPPDVLIAGWPRAMNDVPLVTQRSALITYETHLPYHEEYTREMRRRMQLLIAAYFATDLAPILRLQAEFGVTHLLVDRLHFEPEETGGVVPTYFNPFRPRIHRMHAAAGQQAQVLQLAEQAGVFDQQGFLILDLQRLGSELR